MQPSPHRLSPQHFDASPSFSVRRGSSRDASRQGPAHAEGRALPHDAGLEGPSAGVKIYLDNDVVSAIAKGDKPDQALAICNLLLAAEADLVELCTSDVHHYEIERYAQSTTKADVRNVFERLGRVPFLKAVKFNWGRVGSLTWEDPPKITVHPRWERLRSIGVKETDAHHLLVAIEASCDIFVTCDKGILHRAEEIKRDHNIRVARPSEVVIQPQSPGRG